MKPLFHVLAISILFLVSFQVNAQPYNSRSVYFVGHSLVNLNMPAMLKSLAESGGKTHTYDYQIGIGANLQYQYDTTLGNEQGLKYQYALPTGNYNAFVLTEAVPLKGHLQYSHTCNFADSFAIMALNARPDLRMYIYETWHCINSGTTGCQYDPESTIAWRQRLTKDLDLWESIADSLNAWRSPQNAVKLVPAGQALALLYDSVVAGKISGYTQMSQFFTDDIHLTLTGNYFIACVMYATLYGESPEGLTNKTKDEWGGSFPDIPTTLALQLQKIAWKAVCGYTPLGYSCSVSTGIINNDQLGSLAEIAVVFNKSLRIENKAPGVIEIIDLLGRTVFSRSLSEGVHMISTENITSGIYVAKFISGTRIVYRKCFFEH